MERSRETNTCITTIRDLRLHPDFQKMTSEHGKHKKKAMKKEHIQYVSQVLICFSL